MGNKYYMYLRLKTTTLALHFLRVFEKPWGVRRYALGLSGGRENSDRIGESEFAGFELK